MSFPPGTILDQKGAPLPSSAMSISGDYEGASTGARMGTFGMSSAGPNASAFRNLATLRKRARDSERNNPNTKGAIDSFVSNLVGTDISPSWNLDNQAQKDELQQLWDDSQLEADFYGISDFYGTEEIACRSIVRDGEVLARFHDVDPALGLIVPLQLQLLEADHLDAAYNDISPEGNEIRFVIEWRNSRRYKYWLWNDHPGESFLTQDNITRIPVDAADIAHVFRPLRAGQARGISWLAPILVKLHDIDIYDDAEVIRKKAAALWGGFIYSDQPVGDRTVGGKSGTRNNGVQSIHLEPGTFPVLQNNQKVAFSETADVGNNYLDYMKTQFRMMARGLGITYEQLTGDLSGVNYTSLRAGLIEFRRLCETIIARTLIFQYCRPYINRWIYTAVLNRATTTISVSEYLRNRRIFHRVDWNLDGWDFTDPVKDRVAELMDIRNGIATRGQKVAKRGGNLDRVDKQNEAEIQKAADKGLVYDCYPSQVDKTGTMQKVEDKVILDSIKTE
ncbi:MAG: phage portal protein [Desulfopila sp.]